MVFRDVTEDGTTRLTGGAPEVEPVEPVATVSGQAIMPANINSTSTTPVVLMTIPIPKAGTWVISLSVRSSSGTGVGQYGSVGLYNGAGAGVPNSTSIGFYPAVGTQVTTSRTIVVTTTGPENYTVRGWSAGAWTIQWVSDTSGYSAVTWYELSGSIGPTGLQGSPGPQGPQGNGKLPITRVLTALGAGTWTKPADLLYIDVEVQGGGGSGGSCGAASAAQHSKGGGGGAGAYVMKRYSASTLPSTVDYFVGAGAAANPAAGNGNTGGTSSFGTTPDIKIDATGGGGGVGQTTNSASFATGGGVSGSTSTTIQDVSNSGQSGGWGWGDANLCASGDGGDSYFGGGGKSINLNSAGQAFAGNPGRTWGAGGSGGAVTGSSGVGANGGLGAAGVVIITEYYSGSAPGPEGPQGLQGTRWGGTTVFVLGTYANAPVTFADGGPPRVGDQVVSSNSLAPGLVNYVTAVVDATHADLSSSPSLSLRGPKGDTGPQGTVSLLQVYPVGSIYMSVLAANPSTLFGGTWAAWGTGRVPVGVDTSNTAFDTVEETGGKLAMDVADIPAHTHPGVDHLHPGVDHLHGGGSGGSFLKYVGSGGPNALGTVSGSSIAWSAIPTTGAADRSLTTGAADRNLTTGNNNGAVANPTNNVQPYITCYMWKRTA